MSVKPVFVSLTSQLLIPIKLILYKCFDFVSVLVYIIASKLGLSKFTSAGSQTALK